MEVGLGESWEELEWVRWVRSAIERSAIAVVEVSSTPILNRSNCLNDLNEHKL